MKGNGERGHSPTQLIRRRVHSGADRLGETAVVRYRHRTSNPGSAKEVGSSVGPAPPAASGDWMRSERGHAGRRSFQLWVIDGAGHTAGLATSPREYEERVVGFFDRLLLADRPADLTGAALDSLMPSSDDVSGITGTRAFEVREMDGLSRAFEGVEIPARTESLRYSFTSGEPNAAAGDWSAAGVQLVLAPSHTEATALVEVLTTGEGWRTQSAAATAASSGPRSRSGHVRFTETSRRGHVAFTSVRQRSTAPLTRTRRRRWPGRALLGSPSERPDRASTPRGRCRCLRARGAETAMARGASDPQATALDRSPAGRVLGPVSADAERKARVAADTNRRPARGRPSDA